MVPSLSIECLNMIIGISNRNQEIQNYDIDLIWKKLRI